MKALVFVFAVVLSSFGAFAAGPKGATVLLMPNGDVRIDNIGSGYAAPRTIVELNTNVDSRVVCQVFYRDNRDPQPMDPEAIEQTDKLVNLLLRTYLKDACRAIAPDELDEAYRSGEVFDYLTRFPAWLEKAVGLDDEVELDLAVIAVSMTAVGDLQQRLSE